MQNQNDIKRDTKNLAHDAKAAFSDLSNDGIKQLTSQLIDELSEFLESKKDDVVGVRDKCKKSIKENPFVAVLGTLAIGALIGIILKR